MSAGEWVPRTFGQHLAGFLSKTDRILIYNTGSGYKYLEAWKQHLNEA